MAREDSTNRPSRECPTSTAFRCPQRGAQPEVWDETIVAAAIVAGLSAVALLGTSAAANAAGDAYKYEAITQAPAGKVLDDVQLGGR